ncbi:hypothetical protein CUMW_027210 [Citrus unshiu]|nr:hypothetical protein CUMW_027210 [Citrus unshiu]
MGERDSYGPRTHDFDGDSLILPNPNENFTISHAVADGPSALHFIFEWPGSPDASRWGCHRFLTGKFYRPESLPSPILCLDHAEFDHPPLLIGKRITLKSERRRPLCPSKRNPSERSLRTWQIKVTVTISDSRLAGMRRDGTFVAMCMQGTWALKPSRQLHWVCCVDSRSRMQPPLPRGYFGNATLDVIALSRSGELVSKPLGYASSKIRRAIVSVTEEYGEMKAFYGNPNLGVVRLVDFPNL